MSDARHTGLKVLFVLIWGILALDVLAQYLALYWLFDWFDLVTHFLGGLWVGLAVLWFWYRSGYARAMARPTGFRVPFELSLSAALGVGVLWELYEYGIWVFSHYGVPDAFMLDALGDLGMDLLGASLGALLFTYARRARVRT